MEIKKEWRRQHDRREEEKGNCEKNKKEEGSRK